MLISLLRNSLLFITCLFTLPSMAQHTRWSEEKASKWYQAQPWLVGCNYIPSDAINQLEMWQGETFNPAQIDYELGLASELGFNTMRVFLHDLPWKQDSTSFLKRLENYLEIADKHGIKTMFVLFDGVWDPEPKAGKQPEPIPYVHNSRWVQSPGANYLNDETKWKELEVYVKGVIHHFANDKRVIIWDLFNEADNSNPAYRKTEVKNKADKVYELMEQTFSWAREVNPSQPLTACVWHGKYSGFGNKKSINRLAIESSDIISFHCYNGPEMFSERVKELQYYKRPLVCTEYLARNSHSNFKNILPIMKKDRIAAYNWGFVSGKTQTIYPWTSWVFRKKKEPTTWFHDIIRKDGTPFSTEEASFLKNTNFTTSMTTINLEDFNKEIDGKSCKLYSLANSYGMKATITNYGGRVVSLIVPDRTGIPDDIVLGFSSLDAYQKSGEPYFGALIGRYGNRIAKGKFELDGITYSLATNNGINHLHGGKKGFNNVVWDVEEATDSTLILTYLSKDGEEGYPGDLKIKVKYSLTSGNELKVEYEATTNKATPINLTHHSFFNLHGEGNGTVNDHILTINADYYTPVDEGLIPLGEIAPVANTPFDFTKPKTIGRDITIASEQLQRGFGYDHNFVLNKNADKDKPQLAARIEEPLSGRVMEVWTTEPGMQLYGGNFLKGKESGKSGKPYIFRSAFCLETQHYPDSPNHHDFPSTILKPGEIYRSFCSYRFYTN